MGRSGPRSNPQVWGCQAGQHRRLPAHERPLAWLRDICAVLRDKFVNSAVLSEGRLG
jgi:hypothetical protein